MRILMLAVFITTISVVELSAQRLSLSLNAFPNIAKDYSTSIIVPYSGIGITSRYGEQLKWSSELNFRSVPWGSEVNVAQGFNFGLVEKQSHILLNTTNFHVGLPLLYNKFAPSLALSNQIKISITRLNRFEFSLGLRYNIFPAYRNISSNYGFFESSVGIHYVMLK